VRVRLVESLGAPEESVVAEEVAVLGLVLGSGTVPPTAVGPYGGLGTDRATFDPGGGGCRMVAHRTSIPVRVRAGELAIPVRLTVLIGSA
jgi:hypothetical protein